MLPQMRSALLLFVLGGFVLVAMIVMFALCYPLLWWRFAPPLPDHQELRENPTQHYNSTELMGIAYMLFYLPSSNRSKFFDQDEITNTSTKVWNARLALFLDVCGEGPDGFVAREGVLTIKDTPLSCQGILKDDVASGDEATNCSAWCQQELGPSHRYSLISPFCTIVARSDVNTVCSKARTAEFFKVLQSAWVVGALGALYVGASLFEAKRRSNSMSGIIADEYSKPPSTTSLSAGNADDPPTESFAIPFCFLHKRFGCGPQTDMERASLQQDVSAPGIVLDNPLDVVGALTFLGSGQPYYAICTALGLSFVMVKDPLQIRGIVATLKSCQRGYATEGLVRHQAHEGMEEGPVSGVILVFSLFNMRTIPNNWWTLPLRLLSVASSLFMAIPGGAGARALLAYREDQGLNFDDFYEVEKAKQKISFTVKYWPSVLVLHWSMDFAIMTSFARMLSFFVLLMGLYGQSLIFEGLKSLEDPGFDASDSGDSMFAGKLKELKNRLLRLVLRCLAFQYFFVGLFCGVGNLLVVIYWKHLDAGLLCLLIPPFCDEKQMKLGFGADRPFVVTMRSLDVLVYLSTSIVYIFFISHQLWRYVRSLWLGESATRWYTLLPSQEDRLSLM